MSKSDEFRQATKKFWSKMDQINSRIGKSGSSNTPRTGTNRPPVIALTAPKTHKKTKRPTKRVSAVRRPTVTR